MRRFLGLIAVFWIAANGAATGQSQSSDNGADYPIVVELFTSQGCSSCPPADVLLHKLSARSDVITLALHVDYWDYIGWKDVFAKPAFTERQHAYARAGNRRSVYTPQMIVSGVDHVVGNRPKDVAALIARHTGKMGDVALRIARSGDKIDINVSAHRPIEGKLVVQLVRYIPRQVVAIKRGENAGRNLSYSNIVTDWRVLRDWNPAKPINFQTRIKGDAPVVVIVQRKGQGAILAAARLR
ncbi:MAG: DUF1223 domain-containing protein [Rhodobacterales bacterium]|nr:DUF1223 domain-containing protein [Rhodobacterales bacterium]